MGGKSQKQTVGHKYHLGGHQVICQGPIDRITEIRVKDLTAWTGNSTGGAIEIDAEHLFGGSKEPVSTTFGGGDNTEANGIAGTVDILMGTKTQTKNSYLQQVLGNLIPAFRGVVSAVLRQCYIGNSEYPDAWSFLATRIHTKEWGEPQWYDEKAEIKYASFVGFDVSTSFDYQVSSIDNTSAVTDIGSVVIPTSGWVTGTAPFGTHASGYTPPQTIATSWPAQKSLWLRKIVSIPSDQLFLKLIVSVENACYIWWDGQHIGSINATNVQVDEPYNEIEISIPPAASRAGSHTLAIFCLDESIDGGSSDATYFHAQLAGYNASDLNPAHWLRELYTSKRNAMGHPETEVNDVALTAVADTLYNEGVGISLLWDQQKSVDEMFDLTLEHIEAVHYVNEEGLLTVKLIRDDYNVDDLMLVDESIVIRVEKYSSTNQLELVNAITGVYDNTMTRKEASVMVADPALVQTQGKIKSATIQLPFFSNPVTTIRRITAELRKKSNSLMAFELVCKRNVAHLNIGDVFVLNLPEHNALNVVMRIFDKKKGNGLNNEVRLICTQDIYSLPAQAIKVVTPDAWVNPRTPAAPVLAQLTFELPYYELVQAQGQTEVDSALTDPTVGALGVAAVRPGGSTINAQIMVDAGGGYRGAETLEFCPTALLATAMTHTTKNISFTDDIDVDLIALGSHCQIGDELFVIEALNVAAKTATVGRGVLDTVPQLHVIGDRIWFWDFYTASDTQTYIDGQSVNVKVLPNSSSGRLAIAEAASQSFMFDSRAARPYPPGNFRVNGVAFGNTVAANADITFEWSHRDRIAQTAGTLQPHTYGNIGPESGTTYNLRIYNQYDILIRTQSVSSDNYVYTITQEQIDNGGGGGSSQVVDPLWSKTSLLLNFNGANGSPTFIDISTESATVVGDAKISTTEYKFGGSALKLDGAGDYIYFNDSDYYHYASGDFTIECWVYGLFNSSGYVPIIGQMVSTSSDSNRSLIYYSSSTDTIPNAWCFYDYTTSTNILLGVADSPPTNTWFHLAITKQGSSYRFFRNGTQIGTTQTSSNSIQNVAGNLYIGAARLAGSLKYLTGYVDALRITKGAARYTSNFTPSTRAPEKYIKDVNWPDNILALTFDGEHDSKDIIDTSDSGLTISVFGNAVISSSQFKYGTSSLSLDGDGTSFISAPFNSAYSGTSDFTIDAFVYTSDVSRSGTIACTTTLSTGSRSGWVLGMTNTGRLFVEAWTDASASAFLIYPATSLNVNTWYHIALVRNGSTWTLYLNGTSIGSATESAAIGVSGDGIYIGRDQWTLITWLGYIDEFRVRSGAKYTSNFTAPSASFLPIDTNWSNVVLLANFNGSNNSLVIENSAEVVNTATAFGNAQISTAQSKFGGSAGDFDGAGDYISFPNNDKFNFGLGDYTIELWINPAAIGSIMTLFSRYQTWSAAVEFYCHITAAGKIQYRAGNGVPISVTSVNSVVANTWTHVAITCNSGVTRLFLDGVLEASTSVTASLSSNQPLGIAYELTGGVYYYSGFIDDMRITKGAARYTANFAPPAKQFSKFVPALNSQIRIELESVRDGLTSMQKYNHTITRAA